ncbi:MAG: cytochrome b/b6 domain-containing protein [Anaerolineales bacterium]|jgi:cytochrome b561|nr:cytochrome b/b6 domain-containing protein [Anaerolineales bacterium]
MNRRYRPLYVSLHWLSALLVLSAFLIGLSSLANKPNDAAKLIPLGVHVGLGLSILFLTVARLIVRARMGRPVYRIERPQGMGGRKVPLLDVLSVYVQPLLYLFTFLMALVGIWLAIPSDLFAILFPGSEKSLPPDFYAYPARAWHGTLSLVLMLLIGQHILAFLYHQFLRGENFIGRMWFVKKSRN